MIYNELGNTGIQISRICLGTMTWGEQNTEAEAHQQLDYALERGINFVDTAELYPVPPKEETQGRTEEYIGSWLTARGNRDKIVLASKVVGSGREQNLWFRGEPPSLSAKHIRHAIEGSLKRLKTDYLDLYQLHWPDRSTNYFGQMGYRHFEEQSVPIEETLRACDDLVKEGKVRHIGISNETPWGVMQYLNLSKEKGLTRVQTIQNPYNLLNRTFEIGLAEFSHREGLGLLAYSPLAFGMLAGKYLNGAQPEGSRLTLFKRFARYSGPQAQKPTELYVELARKHGLSPAQMALAYVNSRPFVTANIIGATNLEQLAENIDSIDLELSEEVLAEIEAIHKLHPNPCA